jgi:hypothetical protein
MNEKQNGDDDGGPANANDHMPLRRGKNLIAKFISIII